MSNIRNPSVQNEYPVFEKVENDKAPGFPKRATSEIANESWFFNFRDFLGDAECHGNVSLLFGADDISSEEKIILRSYLKTTGAIAGCQQVRKKIGACCFGFRVVQGEMSPSCLEGCVPVLLRRRVHPPGP